MNKSILKSDRAKSGGWMILEALLTISLLLLLIGAMALSQRAGLKANTVQLTRQQCIAAAQSQLDSLSARGLAMSSDEITRLWPTVRTNVAISAGQGQWAGLQLATVRATGQAGGKDFTIELSRYYDRPIGVLP
jgi:hypothetical protein